MSNELLDQVCKKLTENNIKHEKIIQPEENAPNSIKFKILSGRDEHDCMVYEEDRTLQKMCNSNFEKYRFIQGYEAIWSFSLRNIECEVIQSGSFCRPALGSILRKLSRYTPSSNHTLDSKYLTSTLNHFEVTSIELEPIGNIKVSIGLCSEEFAILSACRQWEEDLDRFQRLRITLKLSEVEVKTHDEAYKIMEKISNSLFFQIDLLAELSINLVTQRENRFQRREQLKKRANKIVDKKIETPKYEYDPEPMSFYWHAKNSSGMPLFQFLAYYQTIEFYFPVYSNYEAKQKIQNLIKDPRFNPNKDADITKILNSIKVFGGKVFGSESDQLKATIKNCVTNEDLKEFFESKSERKNFYQENKCKTSQYKITIKSERPDFKPDFINEVAERLYDIRCLIVHTKSDYKIINPFSAEVKELIYDLELVEFVARKVLISSSRPLKVS